MINQILASLRRRTILTPFRTFLHQKQRWFCSGRKDDEKIEGEETVVSLGKQDIERMKAMLMGRSGPVVEGEEGEGQEFFQGKEVRLSLKLLQIDSIQQLKPLITQYTSKQTESETDPGQLTRCKFFILLKYVNLEGSLLANEISGLFKDIALNLKHLDEDIFTVFLRLIANDSKAKQAFRNLLPKVVLNSHPSNSNSELLSLLLMIYPEAKDDIYLHYHLKTTRKIEGEERNVIYDPINMVHILSHYFYYEDVHKLFESTMRTASIEESDAYLQQFIRTEEDFTRRKAEAIIYAVSHELHQIYSKYLAKEYFDFGQLEFKYAVQLLMSFTVSNHSQNTAIITQCIHQLIKNLLGKTAAFITDDDGQAQQNESFKVIAQIIASYMRRKQGFLQKEDMISLIKSVLDANSAWRVKFDLFAADELFAVIVSYKASKDFLRVNHIDMDSQGILFAAMLASFKEVAAEVDRKQLFYVCLFAHQLQALPNLKSRTVLEGLTEFRARKDLSSVVQQQLRQIIEKLEALQ